MTTESGIINTHGSANPPRASTLPVVALTGHLGAGKTTLLNHLLRQSDARIGVVVNDFGDINVDAAMVSGQVDEPASFAGGCLCCLVDDDAFDQALEKLSRPRLGLDVVIVEASGVAEPLALATLIQFSTAEGMRPGGLIDVVDAVEYFNTVDTGDVVPSRFSAASLVVINKCDRLPTADREATLARIEQRVREANPNVHIVRTSAGRIDPALLFDVASTRDLPDELPFLATHREEHPHDGHQHAAAATVQSPGPVDPGRLIDLLEDPPPGAYRIKGRVAVRSSRSVRGYVVNLVGTSIHIVSAPVSTTDSELVAVGLELDVDTARRRLEHALSPAGIARAAGYGRLQQYRRLSMWMVA
ncbi:CobW family GTP-binding protein [Actinopolymorpha pittospori]|uniref:G3E family GTPase n=1 Tax=Actinopolymorpha pittospori TaxID=648752 RepID=A0A927R7C4_9ACTN|nr:GTP-binding protein [Actinopolymorpha pittospori]MBE1604084.1 G3E family GTPase [Actinopolymorpha pittospori]